jgi:hypothetical protein
VIAEPLDILFAQSGQSVFYDAPEGRPSAPTVQIWWDQEGDKAPVRLAPSGAASVDAVNTTFASASGQASQNQKQANLTSVANIAVGRQYLLTNSLSETEWGEVTSKGGAYVLLRAPMQNSYANPDTFQGTRISQLLDPTWVADEVNLSDPFCLFPKWRVVWSYTAAGVACRAATYFDLVRYQTTFGVTGADVDGYAPGWLDSLSIDDRNGGGVRVIRQAVRQVKRDLSKAQQPAWAQRNSVAFNELIMMMAAVLALRTSFMRGATSRDQYETAKGEYWTHFNEWVGQAKSPTETAADGSGGRRAYSNILTR